MRTLRVRMLGKKDIPAYRDHLLALDRSSRGSRFGCSMSDDAVIKFAELPLNKGEYILGVFEGERLVGVGELRGTAEAEGEFHAEAAISVSDDYRNRGLGSRIMSSLRLDGIARGIKVIDLVTLPDNTAVRKIAKHLKMLLRFDGDYYAGSMRTTL